VRGPDVELCPSVRLRIPEKISTLVHTPKTHPNRSVEKPLWHEMSPNNCTEIGSAIGQASSPGSTATADKTGVERTAEGFLAPGRSRDSD
jgi:hypothetical protein